MADEYKQPPMLKRLKIQAFDYMSHEQKPQVSKLMLLKFKNQQIFHCKPGVPHFEEKTDFHELHRRAATRITSLRKQFPSEQIT